MHVPVILFEYINLQPLLVQEHKPKNHCCKAHVIGCLHTHCKAHVAMTRVTR